MAEWKEQAQYRYQVKIEFGCLLNDFVSTRPFVVVVLLVENNVLVVTLKCIDRVPLMQSCIVEGTAGQIKKKFEQ